MSRNQRRFTREAVGGPRAKAHRPSGRRTPLFELLEPRLALSAMSAATEGFDSSQILVLFDEAVSQEQARALGGVEQLGTTSWWTVPVAAGADVLAQVAAYQGLAGVEDAMPDYEIHLENDYVTPTDQMFNGNGCQWGLWNRGGSVCGFGTGTAGADIDAQAAWQMSFPASTGSDAVVVAVIDTGVDYNHPDLAANIWVNPREIANGIDDDGNKLVDDVRGWDFVSNDKDPMDGNGHGTHVAGIIGASANNDNDPLTSDGDGLVGVAWNVSIMPLRILDNRGSGKASNAIKAIDYARVNFADIANNSYTLTGLDTAVLNYTAADGLFVAAAGNSNSNNDVRAVYPANLKPGVDTVISVAASTRADAYASFTNYGATTVDLAAPGEAIWSAYPFALDRKDYSKDGYTRMDGTSMAAPYVAGVAALLESAYPTLKATEVKARILGTVEQPSALTGKTTLTNGRLNAAQALDPNFLAAPTGLSAAVSGASVTLTWSDNAFAPFVNDAGYRVERAPQGTSDWTPFNASTDAVSWTDANVSAGTYLYRVAARKGDGGVLSAYSKSVSVTVGGGTASSAASVQSAKPDAKNGAEADVFALLAFVDSPANILSADVTAPIAAFPPVRRNAVTTVVASHDDGRARLCDAALVSLFADDAASRTAAPRRLEHSLWDDLASDDAQSSSLALRDAGLFGGLGDWPTAGR